MTVEKAKNSRQMATYRLPKPWNTVVKATWAMFSAAGFSAMLFTFRAPLVSITRAVMVRTMKVSMNTQIIATMP